ncbi:MAG: hypothetical protein MZV70_55695 [Desulfobacterales bacterium]|nr:hypothetical protein [Desulfobacterales bacterium]
MLGGSIGALSRYSVSLLAVKLFGVRFPWGTLIVNLSGCFLIGLSFALAERGSSWMGSSCSAFLCNGVSRGFDHIFDLCIGVNERSQDRKLSRRLRLTSP